MDSLRVLRVGFLYGVYEGVLIVSFLYGVYEGFP